MVALERLNILVNQYIAYEIDEAAIKVSNYNYPQIEHMGDVTCADFTKYRGFDLLLGGSPCTYWSIARADKGTRETEPTGLGYKLFMQYVRALKEVKPKYFLYENNKSISQEIKDAITKELGVSPIMINSALVSGQERKRMYWTNIPNVEQPKDKGIMFRDLVKKDRKWFPLLPWCMKEWSGVLKLNMLRQLDSCKSFCLTTNKSHPQNYYLNDGKTMMTKLDADEAEMLQTLPIGYTSCIPEGKRFKAIGNGWTVDVIAHILKEIKN